METTKKRVACNGGKGRYVIKRKLSSGGDEFMTPHEDGETFPRKPPPYSLILVCLVFLLCFSFP